MYEFKYSPNTINDVILPDRIRTVLQSYIDSGNVNNLLFVGDPGTGKTTCAKIIPKDMNYEYKFINAAMDFNIDSVRFDITNFVTNKSLFSDNPYKIIVLDEIDNANNIVAQNGLKSFIEQFSESCRFIFTANDINGVIEPLKSRLNVIDFSLNVEDKKQVLQQLVKRVKDILGQESINYESDILSRIIKDNFPDYRKILKVLESNATTGTLTYSNGNVDIDELYKVLKNKRFDDMRKWSSENYHKNFHLICKMIYDRLFDKCLSMGDMILILADYQYKDNFKVDKEINLAAMLTELMYKCNWS